MEWVIGGFVVLIVLGAIFKPSRCDVCGTGFKKNITPGLLKAKSSICALIAIAK